MLQAAQPGFLVTSIRQRLTEGKALLRLLLILPLLGISCTAPASGAAACRNDVAALDIEFQAAVASNDTTTIDRLLPSDYILVSATGEVQTKADLLHEAHAKTYLYTRQDDSHRTVRIWGDTAVLTALLWAKGTAGGRTFNVRVWFSDTYTCTADGWRYVFAQVGTHEPAAPTDGHHPPRAGTIAK
ncbi:MAG TPA: nuclear transport factor 2 family protein [Steroidobacteraceae bacterium]